jgi:nucleotide-binding universal stress UspA family protein
MSDPDAAAPAGSPDSAGSAGPAPSPSPGPVVIGYDGSESGEDALALGLLAARALGSTAIVTVVYPAPAPIGVGRVDAEWVADRHRAAEQILDQAHALIAARLSAATGAEPGAAGAGTGTAPGPAAENAAEPGAAATEDAVTAAAGASGAATAETSSAAGTAAAGPAETVRAADAAGTGAGPEAAEAAGAAGTPTAETSGAAAARAGAAVEYRTVDSTSAAHGVHDLAEEVGASLAVVGSHGKGPERRLFAGSTAHRLFSGAHCPVGIAPRRYRDRVPERLTRVGVAYIPTPEANAALAEAVHLAVHASAEMRLYTVVAGEAEVMPMFIGQDAERAFTAAAREEYQFALDTAIAGVPPGVPATSHLLTGNVVDLLAELDQDDVDVLFCGSRGYGPVRRVLLGGVSARLVRQARTPLIVVPRGG